MSASTTKIKQSTVLLPEWVSRVFHSALFCLFIFSASAQTPCQDPPVPAPPAETNRLWAGSDKTLYQVGEPILFRILSNVSGPCVYTIREDRYLPVLATGTLDLVAGVESIVTFSMAYPTFLAFTVDQGGSVADAGVGIEACAIEPVVFLPNDFDRFWDSLKTELAAVPINPQITRRDDHSSQAQTTYKMVLDNIDGKKVYGWISIPNCPGPFAAILSLPSFGNFPVGPNTFDAADGAIGVAISIHDYDCEETVPDTIAYAPGGHFLDRNTNYYKAAILGCLRTIDYLFTRPDFDGVHMAVTGVSQGGGLALMTAGLDPRVKYVAQGVTALCNHAAYASERSSGFPYWVRTAVEQFGADTQLVIRETGYYDVVHFARRYKGPSYNFVGYNDEICPPASVFAAYNQLTGNKTMFHSITTGHNNPLNFWPDRLAFWKEQGIPFSKFWEGCPPVPPADVVAPGQVGNLALTNTGFDNLTFTFTATGDDLDAGTAYRYELRYSRDTITDTNFDDAGKLEPILYPFPPGTVQTYHLSGLDSGTTYFFGIRAVDEADNAGPAAVAKGITLALASSCLPGGIVFDAQQKIDAFGANYPGCRQIEGWVLIDDQVAGNITNLNGLAAITAVGGYLRIQDNNALSSLAGLENLNAIGQDFYLGSNATLGRIEAVSNLSTIGESLLIENNDALTDLQGLGRIAVIPGSLVVQNNNQLLNLDGLESLDSIGAWLDVYSNASLLRLSGLDELRHVGENVRIFDNPSLQTLNGLEKLERVAGYVLVEQNQSLLDVDGLSGLQSIGLDLILKNNPALADVTGFSALESVGRQLVLESNAALESLMGLDNIHPDSITELYLVFSPKLSECDVQSICNYLKIKPEKPAFISGNASGCASRLEVETACTIIDATIPVDRSPVELFPNPVADLLVLRGEDIWRVAFTDVLGRTLDVFDVSGSVLDVSSLPPGIYTVQIQTKTQLIYRQLVKK
ncbi:MAG: acetylxylan esterase [Saprospiraceae bacterium]|nr:acetylxylan esterase [Saprospiraceae bacterium]